MQQCILCHWSSPCTRSYRPSCDIALRYRGSSIPSRNPRQRRRHHGVERTAHYTAHAHAYHRYHRVRCLDNAHPQSELGVSLPQHLYPSSPSKEGARTRALARARPSVSAPPSVSVVGVWIRFRRFPSIDVNPYLCEHRPMEPSAVLAMRTRYGHHVSHRDETMGKERDKDEGKESSAAADIDITVK